MSTTIIDRIKYTSDDAVVNSLANLNTELATGSKRIILGAGTYSLSSALTPQSNTIIDGAGIGITILQGSNITLLSLSSVNNCTFRNMTFDGQSTATVDKIIMTSANNITFENCSFINSITPVSFFSVTTSNNCILSNCTFSDMTEWAMLADVASVEWKISGCTFTDCTNTVGNNGTLRLPSNTSLTNCIFDGCSHIFPRNDSVIDGNIIKNSQTNSGDGDIFVALSESIDGVVISNNTFVDSSDFGIEVGSTGTNVIIQGNHISGAGTESYQINSSSTTCVGKNNAVDTKTDPPTLNGYADRILVTTTFARSTSLTDLTAESAGHRVYIEVVSYGANIEIQALSSSLTSNQNITFSAVNQYVILEWDSLAWRIVENQTAGPPKFNELLNTRVLQDKIGGTITIDDEFDAPTLNSKWTLVGGGVAGTVDLELQTTPANPIYDLTTIPGRMLIQVDGGSGLQRLGLRQMRTLLPGTGVTVCFSPAWNFETLANNELQVILAVTDSTTDPESGSPRYTILFDTDADNGRILSTGSSGGTVDTSTTSSLPLGGISDTVYFRIIHSSTTAGRFTGFFSFNGSSWTSLGQRTLGGVPTQLWVSVESATSISSPIPITTLYWVRQGGVGVLPY